MNHLLRLTELGSSSGRGLAINRLARFQARARHQFSDWRLPHTMTRDSTGSHATVIGKPSKIHFTIQLSKRSSSCRINIGTSKLTGRSDKWRVRLNKGDGGYRGDASSRKDESPSATMREYRRAGVAEDRSAAVGAHAPVPQPLRGRMFRPRRPGVARASQTPGFGA